MKTQNHITITILASLAYYFGYKQDVLIFQILSWGIMILAFILHILGFSSMSLIDFSKDGQGIKDKYPTKFQMILGVPFLILNSWIFYGHQLFYFYIYLMITGYVLMFKTYQKLKEHNFFN